VFWVCVVCWFFLCFIVSESSSAFWVLFCGDEIVGKFRFVFFFFLFLFASPQLIKMPLDFDACPFFCL